MKHPASSRSKSNSPKSTADAQPSAGSWIQRIVRRLLPGKKSAAQPSEAAPQKGDAASRPPARARRQKPQRDLSATPRPPRQERPRDSHPVPSSLDSQFPVISTTAELEEAVKSFSGLSRIALDTEADSLHCYFDKLCLVQITIPGKDLLIDPLSGLSLDPMFRALEGKTLVIHSADYDLRLMRRSGYTGPTVLFDTMIAARLCGATEFGLAALLNQHFGLTIAKASQKANWARRPLPREMLEYAVNDTRNLLTLAEIQEARLRELGRWEWFEQSCERAIRSAGIIKERDPDTLWRITGYADLSPRGTAILRALWHWRDQEAQAVDKPAFHILNNDLLLEFSERFDKGEPVDPRHLRGPRKTRFFEAAEGALQLDEAEWPRVIRKPRLRTTQEAEARFRELRKHRDQVAQKLQLDPTLIAAKGMLEQLSRNEPAAFESLMPWQKQCLNLE